jgi:hypothetical protein
VAFASNPPTGTATEVPDPGPYGLLGLVLDDLVAVGFMSAARQDAEALCWSVMHGFAQLNIDGPLGDALATERAQALEHLLEAIDRSCAATTGARISPGDLQAGR